MTTIILLFIILFGLIFGSFFNVLISRLPKGTFFNDSRSHCPHCQARIRYFDNIPLLSYLWLRGRCRNCGNSISLQYPFVEASTALFAVLLFKLQHWNIQTPWICLWQAAASFQLLFLIPITVIDLRHRIIPDALSLGGLVTGLLLSLIPGNPLPTQALLGVLVGGGSLFLVGVAGQLIFKKEAMGGGDVKLMAMAGALLGPWNILLAFFLGSLFGSIGGLFVKLRTGQSDIAFGPALSLGILLAYLFGDNLIRWYLSGFYA